MSIQRPFCVARREGGGFEYSDSLSSNVKMSVMHALNLFPEGDFVEISFPDREFAVMDKEAKRIGGTKLPSGWKLQMVKGKWTFVQREKA